MNKKVFFKYLMLGFMVLQLPTVGISENEKRFDAVFQHPINSETLPSLTSISNHLKSRQLQRAKFIQKKHIKILSRPLVSKGSMIFSQKWGLFWQLDFPFHSKTIYTKDGMFQWKQGKKQSGNNDNKLAIIKGITSSFIAAFSGNLEEMEKQYNIYFFNQSNRWMIGLIPKFKPLSNVIKKMVLSGASDLGFDTLVIFDAGGDLTEILFTMAIKQQKLTKAELKYFQ